MAWGGLESVTGVKDVWKAFARHAWRRRGRREYSVLLTAAAADELPAGVQVWAITTSASRIARTRKRVGRGMAGTRRSGKCRPALPMEGGCVVLRDCFNARVDAMGDKLRSIPVQIPLNPCSWIKKMFK